MPLYLDSCYLDFEYIYNKGLPFNFIMGGRGTGKTYGALKYTHDNNIKAMIIRRTQAQVDLISKNELSPYRPIEADEDVQITCKPISKYMAGFYHPEDHVPFATLAALSTFSNLRGFSDGGSIKACIFDEFIPEAHERPITNEFDALANLYETINRNRELKGEEPLRLFCLANSNNIANEILMGFKLVLRIARMKDRGLTEYIDRDRGIGVWLLDDSGISRQKSRTALYRATEDTSFAGMALANDFNYKTISQIKSENLKAYRPLFTYGELTAYEHKYDGRYYVCSHASGTPQQFLVSDNERFRCKQAYLNVFLSFLQGLVIFEDLNCEILFRKYFKY